MAHDLPGEKGDRGEGRTGLSISSSSIASGLTQEVGANSTQGPVPAQDPGRS